jgi:hypothetical protein
MCFKNGDTIGIRLSMAITIVTHTCKAFLISNGTRTTTVRKKYKKATITQMKYG